MEWDGVGKQGEGKGGGDKNERGEGSNSIIKQGECDAEKSIENLLIPNQTLDSNTELKNAEFDTKCFISKCFYLTD